MSHCRWSFESGFHSRPVTSAGTGCEQLAQLGAALVVSVMLHDRSVPVSMVAASVTSSIQVPLAEIPFRAERGTAGWNEPVYGAVPVPIGPAAASSKTVFVRLSPPLVEPPTRFASDTLVPVGPIRVSTRSPSYVCVRLPILAVTLVTVPRPDTGRLDVIVELSAMIFGTSIESIVVVAEPGVPVGFVKLLLKVPWSVWNVTLNPSVVPHGTLESTVNLKFEGLLGALASTAR